MSDLNTRIPKQISSKTVVYEKSLLTRRRAFAMFVLTMIICICTASLLGANQFQRTFRANMTEVAVSKSTADMALTQTAMPTKTLTLTPTVTLTPTWTYTPTISPTPSPTPVLTWLKSVVDSGGYKPGFFLSMDIDDNGKYYIAYFLDRKDSLMVVEGNGKSWRSLRNLSQLNREGRVGFYVTLDIGSSNFPYLAYFVYDKGVGRGASLVGDGTWSTANIGQNLEILDMRIAIDNKNIPHFALLSATGDVYYRSASTNLTKIQTGVLPTDSVSVLPKYFPITLAVDSSQNPYICYSKLGQLQCTYNSGDTWTYTDVAENGIHPYLQIDSSGNLHLAYYDSGERSLKYAFLPKDSSNWNIFTVDSTSGVGMYPSLKIDSNNLIHISYYDVDNTALKYAIGRLGGWSVYTVDNDGDVGLTSSLVLDAQNNPAIAYYDADRRRIYFIVGHQK